MEHSPFFKLSKFKVGDLVESYALSYDPRSKLEVWLAENPEHNMAQGTRVDWSPLKTKWNGLGEVPRLVRRTQCKGCHQDYSLDEGQQDECPFCPAQDDLDSPAYVQLVRTGHRILWGTEFRYEPSGYGMARYVCLTVRVVVCKTGAWYQSEHKLFYDCWKPHLVEKTCQYVIDHPEVLRGPE